jgi:hypothetical protein
MRKVYSALFCLVIIAGGCGSKNDNTAAKPVEKGREAVKDVVTQDFKTLEGAKDSLKQSDDKTKAALEALDKELK